MPHIDTEMQRIDKKLLEMWDLVEFQLQSGKDAFLKPDEELIKRIIKSGKKVNQYDVKIDRMCENFFALFNPVAVDLRHLLSVLKINSNLERIGDSAEGIAYLIKNHNGTSTPELVKETQMLDMYAEALAMFTDSRRAMIRSNTELAKEIIKRDRLLNNIYRKSDKIIAKYISEYPHEAESVLKLYSIIKKLERVGDQITNICEEIIFFHDAKVIKHKKKFKKDKKTDSEEPASEK